MSLNPSNLCTGGSNNVIAIALCICCHLQTDVASAKHIGTRQNSELKDDTFAASVRQETVIAAFKPDIRRKLIIGRLQPEAQSGFGESPDGSISISSTSLFSV